MRKDEEVLTKNCCSMAYSFFRMRWSDDFSLPENGGHLEKATDSKFDFRECD